MFDYGYDWNFQNIERTKKAKEKKKKEKYISQILPFIVVKIKDNEKIQVKLVNFNPFTPLKVAPFLSQ